MNNGDDLRRSLERLVALGQTPDVNIRPVLLRVIVDLFVRRPHHSPSEIDQFGEIALRLLDEADDAARLTVAEKLSRHAATPKALLDRFLAEGGPAARPVLAHAPLDGDTLLRMANWGTLDAATAVASRADIAAPVAKDLAERPEREILLALARNTGVVLHRPTFQYLVRRARGDDELGRALLDRDNVQALDLAPLFFLASRQQRAAIILAARRDDMGPDHRPARLSSEERAALGNVERAILAPERDNLDAALATALHVSLADAWRILDDPHGESLALALAAIGAPVELAARLFILSAPAISHSVATVRLLTNLVESVPMRTARRLVAALVTISDRAQRTTPAEPETAGRRRAEAGSRPADAVHERNGEQTAPRKSRLAR